MSEKKERKGRRAYLEDFRQDINGQFVYEGDRYTLSEDGPDLAKVKKTALIYTAVMSAVTVAGGFLPASCMLDCFYCILPFAAEFVAVLTVAWATVKLLNAGEELRGYIYEKSVGALPQRTFLAAIFAAIGALGTVLYVILNGFSGTAALTVSYFALKLVEAVIAYKFHKTVLSLKWDVNKSNSQV